MGESLTRVSVRETDYAPLKPPRMPSRKIAVTPATMIGSAPAQLGRDWISRALNWAREIQDMIRPRQIHVVGKHRRRSRSTLAGSW